MALSIVPRLYYFHSMPAERPGDCCLFVGSYHGVEIAAREGISLPHHCSAILLPMLHGVWRAQAWKSVERED